MLRLYLWSYKWRVYTFHHPSLASHHWRLLNIETKHSVTTKKTESCFVWKWMRVSETTFTSLPWHEMRFFVWASYFPHIWVIQLYLAVVHQSEVHSIIGKTTLSIWTYIPITLVSRVTAASPLILIPGLQRAVREGFDRKGWVFHSALLQRGKLQM